MKVSEHFPEAVGNDLGPEASHEFVLCQHRAVKEWVTLNVPAERVAAPPPRDLLEDDELPRRMRTRALPVEQSDDWIVETIGPNGETYTTRFEGGDAEARAMDYLASRNHAVR